MSRSGATRLVRGERVRASATEVDVKSLVDEFDTEEEQQAAEEERERDTEIIQEEASALDGDVGDGRALATS